MATKYRPDQISIFASEAGFSGNDLVIAIAVAMAESGGDTEATHVNTWDGSTDYGLWQINSIHSQLLAGKHWMDPAVNASMAYEIWKGSGWRAWSTYTNGAYLVHMPIALVAANNPAQNPSPTKVNNIASTDSLVKFTGMLTDATTWRRTGLFLAGVAIMVIGIRPLLKEVT